MNIIEQMPGDSNAAKIREQLVKAGDLNTETLLSPLEPNTTQLRRGEINQVNAKKMQRLSLEVELFEAEREFNGLSSVGCSCSLTCWWLEYFSSILRCRSQHSPITYTRLTSLGDNLVLRFETKGVHVVFNWRHMGDGHIHGRNLPIRNVSHYTNFQWESAAGIVSLSEIAWLRFVFIVFLMNSCRFLVGVIKKVAKSTKRSCRDENEWERQGYSNANTTTCTRPNKLLGDAHCPSPKLSEEIARKNAEIALLRALAGQFNVQDAYGPGLNYEVDWELLRLIFNNSRTIMASRRIRFASED
ncbi:hypothetical protein LguiB_016462 [Lonicera macranthoides]